MAEPVKHSPPRLWRSLASEAQTVNLARRRRRQVITRMFLILSVFSGILVMLYWVHPLPHPRYIPVWSAESPALPFPSVPMAEQDLELMKRGTSAASSKEKMLVVQDHHALTDGLKAHLAAIERGGSVIVYVRANAVVAVPDENVLRQIALTDPKDPGQVMILPSDAEPTDRSRWVPLRSILDALKNHTHARHKLLVLDIMQPLTDPRLGILTPSVADLVPADLETVVDDRRLVLTACAPGQASFNSEEMGRSIFNAYLEEGLRGWADGAIDKQGRDGIVKVHELARFVAARVARWATQNRNARQTPVLHGEIDRLDFPLVALDHDRPGAHLPAHSLPDYPVWLEQAWRLRDQWWEDGSQRFAPWPFRRLQANLLMGERDWRGGYPSEQVEKERMNPLEKIEDQRKEAREVVNPRPPRSLALAAALGRVPHPSVVAAVKSLVAQRDEAAKKAKTPEEVDKALEKTVADFQAKAAEWSPFDLAWAVFAEAESDVSPQPEKLIFLDQLLPSDLIYEENLTLRRLAALGRQVRESKAPWPAGTARLVLDIAHLSARAESQPYALPWVRQALAEAAQLRHDGAVLLGSTGFVPSDEAQELLTRSAARYTTILDYESAIVGARHALDDAMLILPPAASFLASAPDLENAWEDAVREAREISAGLAAPPKAEPHDYKFSAAELLQKVEVLKQKTTALRDHLDELRQPFSADAVRRLIARSEVPEADAESLLELDDLLATPFPKAAQRIELWNARRSLSHRLNAATLAIDRQDEAQGESIPVSGGSEDTSDDDSDTLDAAKRRTRWSIQLLGLAADLGEDALKPLRDNLDEAFEPGSTPVRRYLLARDLRVAWQDKVAGEFATTANTETQDRLSRWLSPFLPRPLLDNATSNPTVQLRNSRALALWAWLAERYEYESHDLDGTMFYADAARAYKSLAMPPALSYLEFSGIPERLTLTSSAPRASATISVRASNPDEKPRLEVVAPDDPRLSVAIEPASSTAESARYAVRVSWKVGSETATGPIPQGFLLKGEVDGRSFYAKVPVSVPRLVAPWGILVGDAPNQPAAPLANLRLRPVKDRQTYFVAVVNPTGKPRKVSVEVKDLATGVGGVVAFSSNGSGDREKIGGGTPTPESTAKPDGAGKPDVAPELPELQGPLRIQVLDEENQRAVLAQRDIQVNLASPLEYVRILEAKFTPANPKNNRLNRLSVTLQATTPLSGPPCSVELVLPRDRIPGLIAADSGTFIGTLPADGSELTLFAENIQLRDEAKEDGYFYLNIDSVPRAVVFHATFARQGSPTTPRLEFTPRLRLQAAPSALPGAGFKVLVEPENVPSDTVLEVLLGHTEKGSFVPDTRPVREGRRLRVGFMFLANGTVVFNTAASDWIVPLQTAGIEGARLVLARLLQEDNVEIKSVTLPLVLDNSPPKRVKIFEVPAYAKKGTTVVVKGFGIASESGLKEVNFFVGKPQANKLPQGVTVVPGHPLDDDQTTWAAEVPLPDKKGPAEVSVQFVNNVDLSAFDTAKLELTEADPIPVGRIGGKVVEGERPQADLKVYLVDAKGTARDVKVTNAGGEFLFENVAAGRYAVVSEKSESRTTANEPVEVRQGELSTVELFLRR